MRKYQQKQILDFIKTLYEATAEAKRFLSRKDGNSAIQIFADCQEMAVKIGNYIEHLEGEGTQTVSFLEEYCQHLYQSGVDVSNDRFDAKVEKRLQKQLIKIENSVLDELKPDKLEIAFLSYKASMWDSLESIWLAAKDDPNCDAYVVPIPYYDILQDGSFGQSYCESAQYPDYVPVVDWHSYHVSERHPDVIFIHYAYDDNVNNASVHPDFYSKKLREHCELLVYVPYFITGSGAIEDYYAALPGVLYANRVVVESEALRQSYMEYYKKFDHALKWKGQFGKAEEKFIALGSPKLDKVRNTAKADCDLPPEWKRRIYRSDGTPKKIVLYNTHMFAWINTGEKYFEKLRRVFDVFRNRDDAVLLWRPHPNTELNFRTKRPQWLNAYYALIEDFKRDVGIYDDTADLNRAIAVSDAYFGDGQSSLVALYKEIDKPVMLQNLALVDYSDETLRNEMLHSDVILFGTQILSIQELEQRYPQYYAYWTQCHRMKAHSRFVCVPDYEFGTSAFLNAVYKLDTGKGKAALFKNFPEEKNLSCRYRPPVRFGNMLIFSPMCARRWAFYDLEADLWTYAGVPQALYPATEQGYAFGTGMICDNEIIFIPHESPAFAKYDLDTGEITYHKDLYLEMMKHVTNVNSFPFIGISYYNDSFLFTLSQENIIFEVNLSTMKLAGVYRIGKGKAGFKTGMLIPHTDTVYLVPCRAAGQHPWTETIIKGDLKTGEYKEITNLPIHFIEDSTANALSRILYWNDALYAFPQQGDAVLAVDLKTDEVKRVELTPKFDFFERKNEYYTWAKDNAMPYLITDVAHMNFLAQLPYDYGLADMDLEKGEIKNRRKWDVEGVEALYKEKARVKTGKGHNNEIMLFHINDFIDDLILNGEHAVDGSAKVTDGGATAGQTIYHYVKKSVGL